MAPAPSNPPPAEPAWFYRQHGETYGPVAFAELRAAVQLGFVRRGDLVRPKGRRDWMAAETVPDLFPSETTKFAPSSEERKASP